MGTWYTVDTGADDNYGGILPTLEDALAIVARVMHSENRPETLIIRRESGDRSERIATLVL